MIYGPACFYNDNRYRCALPKKPVRIPVVVNFSLQALADSASKLDRLLHACCLHFETKPLDIKSDCRQYRLANCRHMFAYLAHTLYGKNHSEIGRYLGRDHSTILYGVSKVRANKDSHTETIAAIKALLGSKGI